MKQIILAMALIVIGSASLAHTNCIESMYSHGNIVTQIFQNYWLNREDSHKYWNCKLSIELTGSLEETVAKVIACRDYFLPYAFYFDYDKWEVMKNKFGYEYARDNFIVTRKCQ